MKETRCMQQEQRVRELSKALSLLIECQEEEYRSLALDIHDAVGQSLTSVLLRIKILQEQNDPAGMGEGLRTLEAIVDNSLAEVRRIARVLRPMVLEAQGFIPALERLCESSQEHTGIRSHFRYNGGAVCFSRNEELLVYRIVQEALTNAYLHGRAKNTYTMVSSVNGMFVLSVRDDGCGFDMHSTKKGIGLHGMTERARMIGGKIRIMSRPGAGTHILLTCRMRGSAYIFSSDGEG